MSHVTFNTLPSKWGAQRNGINKLQPQCNLCIAEQMQSMNAHT
jgi:hypothetical protein